MRVVFDRRARQLEIKKWLKDSKASFQQQDEKLHVIAKREKYIITEREKHAASRIQGIVRGYLTRQKFVYLIVRLRACVTIQRIVRGRLGRKRWWKFFYLRTAVVKSDEALKDILARSKLLRTAASPKPRGYLWHEYFDPLTDSFWYYNSINQRNTWDCPLVFQKELVCCWEGFTEFGGNTKSNLNQHNKCRRVFNNVQEYHNHLRRDHSWFCPACDEKNTGLMFPTCSLCGNSRSGDGLDGVTALQQSFHRVKHRLQMFLYTDGAEREPDEYVIKDRLIELTQEKREEEERLRQARLEWEEQKRLEKLKLAGKTKSLLTKEEAGEDEEDGTKAFYASLKLQSSRTSPTTSDFASSSSTSPGTSLKLPLLPINRSISTKSIGATSVASDLEQSMTARLESTKKERAKRKSKSVVVQKTKTVEEVGFNITDILDNPNFMYSTIASKREHELVNSKGYKQNEQEFLKDPLLNGILSVNEFENVTETGLTDKQVLKLHAKDDEDSDDSEDVADNNELNQLQYELFDAEVGSHTKKGGIDDDYDKLLVCQRYLRKECTLTTCPFAHPGIRDSAKIAKVRIPGTLRKVPYVKVCPQFSLHCQDCPRISTLSCTCYHIYIRPSTRELILKIYPLQKGVKVRQYKSGARSEGHVRGNKLNGYAVMTWGGKTSSSAIAATASGAPNTAVGSGPGHKGKGKSKSKGDGNGPENIGVGVGPCVYIGDFKEDVREGLGMLRTLQYEYVGTWERGMKHGWGVCITNNDEEYVGEYSEGFMQGVGVLRNHRTGDIYEGEFMKNKYHGLGKFTKKNGDCYLGYSMNGMAHGIGILKLFTGECYRGYFDRNFRHGYGVCKYANGSKYAGQWYRGVPENFGLYIAPSGKERYIGQWGGGKKEGKGRNYFPNGDFYDGDFRQNKADGKGVYYHHLSGNLFSGEWKNDKRSGVGTYVYIDGSRYTGQWIDNMMQGKGRWDFACGAFYRGQVKNGIKHGKGIYTWPNGNVYKGEFVDGIMCGYGEMQYSNGHRYVGNWKRNKKNGFGVFYYAQGHIYEGEWLDDFRHGKGRMTNMPNTLAQEVYEGDWDTDERHGFGKYIYKIEDGTVYEGEWDRGFRNGKGLLTFKDKSYYRGDFKMEHMVGRGVFVGADGTQYDGEWRNNMRQGTGTLLSADGSIYHGEFWANAKHGKGKIQHSDGTIFTGNWVNDVIVGGGSMTFDVGQGLFDGPTKITVKVLGY